MLVVKFFAIFWHIIEQMIYWIIEEIIKLIQISLLWSIVSFCLFFTKSTYSTCSTLSQKICGNLILGNATRLFSTLYTNVADYVLLLSFLKCILRQSGPFISAETYVLELSESRVCAKYRKKLKLKQHHEFAFINHFIGLTVNILMWNDRFPRQQSQHSNTETHTDSWSAWHQ